MLGILLFLLVPDMVFASNHESAADSQKAKYDIYVMILKVLSWAWIVPASIAGKLMTNDLVYGQIFHFSPVMWKMWNAMRVFANFTLGFVFLALMIKHFVTMEPTTKIFETLKKTVIAGIGIQVSRWVIAVIVDLSIVAIATVSAMPLQLMQNQWNTLRYDVKTTAQYNIHGLSLEELSHLKSEDNIKTISLESIVPNSETLA